MSLWGELSRASRRSENYSLVSVEQNSILHMPANGPRQHDFLQVAAFADQVLDGIAVGNANHVLLDDRAIVEHFGDVVASSADQLYAAFERLMVGAGADE